MGKLVSYMAIFQDNVKSLYPAPDGLFTATFSNRCKKWAYLSFVPFDNNGIYAHLIFGWI